ncbi:MAG: nitroreductase family protein [Methanobacterium sp.]|uniref:nitroreductase family protein n=1 Tax=Methanobacterium sp. TaxID=2164 RepID=UPI003D65CC8D|nr:nitroreductase family protein [Methanobacterium sp.]
MNKVLENIKSRRSIRKYLPEQIKDEELEIILESAIYAPTGHNDQPWHFTVIQNKEFIDKINVESKKVMAEIPVEWISKMGKAEHLHILYNAPTVVVVSGKEDATTPFADCCAAIQNMLLAAESIDIGSCWIGLARFFFENPENVENLGIPEGYKPYYAVTLGYKAVEISNFDASKSEISNGSTNNRAPERNKNVVNYIK